MCRDVVSKKTSQRCTVIRNVNGDEYKMGNSVEEKP